MNIRARAAAARDPAVLAAVPTPALKPAMASRRLQALDFVQDYIAHHNEAPTLSEIGAGLGVGKSRVRDLVDALVAEGRLQRMPGARGLVLPSAIASAAQLLRDAGFVVENNCGVLRLGSPLRAVLDYRPAAPEGRTKTPLPAPPPPAYRLPRVTDGARHHGESRGDERSEAPDRRAAG